MLGQYRARAAPHVEARQDQRVDDHRDGFAIGLELRPPRRDRRRQLRGRAGYDLVAGEGLCSRALRGGRERCEQQNARVVSHS